MNTEDNVFHVTDEKWNMIKDILESLNKGEIPD